MKTILLRFAVLLTILIDANSLLAQGTAFTYQGRLNGVSGPATGTYDFRFAIYDAVASGNVVAGPTTNSAVLVSNGLFTTTIDFGSAAFNGSSRWLEIAVSTNGAGTFFTLSPRQAFTPSPYSITAGTITGPVAATQLTGTIPSSAVAGTYNNQVTLNNANNQIAGTFLGNGAGVTNVNAAKLGGLASSNFWQVGGNNVSAGQFIGSVNSQPVEIRVNNTTGLVIEPGLTDSPNITGGSPVNLIDPTITGSVIAGGGTATGSASNHISAHYSAISGGTSNWIQYGAANSVIGGGSANIVSSNASVSTIAGGHLNSISNNYSAIGGGFGNTVANSYGAIAGGTQNTVNGNAGSVGGGSYNTAGANDSVVVGGNSNVASNNWSTVAGGQYNVAGGTHSFAAGRKAVAANNGSFVWADETDAYLQTTGNNQFLVRASGGVGINTNNPNGSALNVLGNVNATSFSGAFTGNGAAVSNVNATTVNGIGASGLWQLGGNNVSAGQFIGTTNNQSLDLRANNQTALLISPSATDSPNIKGGAAINSIDAGVQGAVIAGGGSTNFSGLMSSNRVSSDFAAVGGGSGNWIQSGADHAFIGGGWGNIVSNGAYQSVIAGGLANVVSTNYGTISGGTQNTVSGLNATVGGGSQNNASKQYATVAGGYQNSATFYDAAVGGGSGNTASGTGSTVGGGFVNSASGVNATVPGGQNNTATGNDSFAAGYKANAATLNTFVWSDGVGGTFTSSDDYQFLIHSINGVGINTNNPSGSALNVAGNVNATSFSGDGSALTNLTFAGKSLSISGSQTGGWPSPVATIANSSTAANASPALRVVAAGTTSNGALSVSATGSGLIAQFGNSAAFVADITTGGAVDATAFNGGSVRVGSSGTTISTLQAGQAIMPASAIVSTNFSITFPQAFTATPKVIASISGDPGFPNASDVFGLTVRGSVSTTGFTVNVIRLDTAGGWSQQLRINWQAWQ